MDEIKGTEIQRGLTPEERQVVNNFESKFKEDEDFKDNVMKLRELARQNGYKLNIQAVPIGKGDDAGQYSIRVEGSEEQVRKMVEYSEGAAQFHNLMYGEGTDTVDPNDITHTLRAAINAQFANEPYAISVKVDPTGINTVVVIHKGEKFDAEIGKILKTEPEDNINIQRTFDAYFNPDDSSKGCGDGEAPDILSNYFKVMMDLAKTSDKPVKISMGFQFNPDTSVFDDDDPEDEDDKCADPEDGEENKDTEGVSIPEEDDNEKKPGDYKESSCCCDRDKDPLAHAGGHNYQFPPKYDGCRSTYPYQRDNEPLPFSLTVMTDPDDENKKEISDEDAKKLHDYLDHIIARSKESNNRFLIRIIRREYSLPFIKPGMEMNADCGSGSMDLHVAELKEWKGGFTKKQKKQLRKLVRKTIRRVMEDEMEDVEDMLKAISLQTQTTGSGIIRSNNNLSRLLTLTSEINRDLHDVKLTMKCDKKKGEGKKDKEKGKKN